MDYVEEYIVTVRFKNDDLATEPRTWTFQNQKEAEDLYQSLVADQRLKRVRLQRVSTVLLATKSVGRG